MIIVNELQISSAPIQKVQQGSYSTGTKPATNALPPTPLKSLSGGNELPSTDSSKEARGRSQNDGAKIAELRQPELKQTEKAVDDLNKAAVSLQRDLNFKVDDDTGKSIITVTDSVTKKVIRQIPSEEIVELAKNLQSMVQKAEAGTSAAPIGSPTGSLLNITA